MAGADRGDVVHHVLLVGAADDLRHAMEAFLRGRGNVVTCTDDAGHALTMAALRQFDAIVVERGRPELPVKTLVDRLVSGGLARSEDITTYAAAAEPGAAATPSGSQAHSSNFS